MGLFRGLEEVGLQIIRNCRIPDDHITPSRRGYLMARDVLRDIFGRHAAKAVKLKEPQA